MTDFTVLTFNFFFFNDTATTEIYTLSLHDALPISSATSSPTSTRRSSSASVCRWCTRSEEHTSELQSRVDLVCRLLLEKKKKSITNSRRGCAPAAGDTTVRYTVPPSKPSRVIATAT